jgi:uncharacterized membrane protein YcjF (UPF0283 family)
MYAGIATTAVCAILYILFYLVPIIKIFKSDYFIVNVNAYTAREAQRHNKQLRHNIADKIIEFTSSVEGVGWYDSKVVGELAIALKAGNEKGVIQSLSNLYSDSVKKSARELITKAALRSGVYSAVSQTNTIDAALVAFVNLQLVKDIVFLYGFRPSDPKLLKIFARVLENSLVAYGLGGVRIGNSIVQTMGNVVKGIPVLGTAISTLVDSSVQGLTNGVLTAVIGYQTIKYLNQEYRLQAVLDGIEIDATEAEVEETCVEIEQELKGSRVNKKPQKASATT